VTGAPLSDFFHDRGVRLRELAPGTLVPAYFSDAATEHMATRRACGLFDFSFVACAEISGRESLAFLHRLQTRRLTRLAEDRLAYTLLLRPDGTVLNDATVWRLGPEHYYLFIGRRADLAHVRSTAADYAVAVADQSSRRAVIAVQGRRAWETLTHCLSGLPPVLPYYAFAPAQFGDARCLVGRLGYSGETGYEIVLSTELGAVLWRKLLVAGGHEITECGFDAVDSLRIEAGHILFSRELDGAVTPYELGFSRLLDFHREPAIGIASLRAQRWQRSQRHFVGLWIDRGSPPAARAEWGNAQFAIEAGTASLTSICNSPTFGRLLGLGFVNDADRYPGTRVKLQGGVHARVARLPFYDPPKRLARSTA
jgi:aminomethyltransferase